MNDNDKNLNMEDLYDKELDKVNGGYHSSEFGEKTIPGTQKIGYCKYCNETNRTLEFICIDDGYEDGVSVGDCNLWRCDVCKKINYYMLGTGILI